MCCFRSVKFYNCCDGRLLNETKGSLLDDEQLVNTLQTSKTTSQEVTEQLQISEQTEMKIDSAREVIFSHFLPDVVFYLFRKRWWIEHLYNFVT